MKFIVLAVILAVVGNAVGYHHGFQHGHHGYHGYHGYHGHHPGQHHDFDHHWHNKPDEGNPWKDKNDKSGSHELSENDSNEWNDSGEGGHEDSWDVTSPPTPLRETSLAECMSSCSLPSSYEPVCGTDHVTYNTLDHLHCARQCGVAVSVRKLSKCANGLNHDQRWPPTRSTAGDDYWTRAPPTNNGFWTKSTPPNGNNFWTKSPSTNSNNFWTRLTTRKPSNGGNDFWTRPDTWGPSTNGKNIWTTPTPSNMNTIELCISSCSKSTSKSPVCGTNNVIYNNLDHLHCAQICGVDVTEQRLNKCPTVNNDGTGNSETTTPPAEGRSTKRPAFDECLDSCPATQEYNPVCGTDGVTYNNLGQLWCAQQCGRNVGLQRQSPCPPTTPSPAPTGTTATTTQSPEVTACIRSCPVTSEYNPICGTDGVTYTNTGRLDCAKFCGVDVRIQANSACPTTLPPSDFDTATSSMVPAALPLGQNNLPIEPDNGGGFTIPADLLSSIFTVAPPDEDIDPRFDSNNNGTRT